MRYYTRFCAFDQHKDTIVPAVAQAGRGHPQLLGRIPNERAAILRWLKRRLEAWGRLDDVLFCYEAGPCGYGLYRLLRESGIACQVMAPSLVPRRPSDRIKTDRRDACKLAGLLRAGELRAIWVPDEEHESFRDLLRAREVTVRDRTKARHRLSKFLLRQSLRPPEGVNPWTKRFDTWVERLKPTCLAHAMVLSEYRQAIEETTGRLSRLDDYIREYVGSSPWRQAIEALQCLRGFGLITAATVIAELGAIARFCHPSELMSYAGLIPSEHSSGNKVRRSSITKAGNSHLRRVLVEAAWHYRHTPRVTSWLRRRQQGQPAEVVAISWRAQTRLNYRYRRLLARGKEKPRVITAIARESLGFVWEILQTVPTPTAAPIAA